MGEDGTRLQLWRGGVSGWDDRASQWSEFRDWDCVDVDDDGTREVVTATGWAQGDFYDVEESIYRMRDGTAVLVDERSSRVPIEADEYPDLIAGACPAGAE